MINQFIVQGSDKWSESIYNEDQDFKYVSMLRSDNDATNLPQVRGTGEEHFRYFVENRLNYCDSKWYAGDYPEDNAIVRIYTPVDAEGVPRTDLVIPANADITVTPYSAMYAGVRYKANGTLYQERLEENETYTFEAPNEIFNDTETAIYGASQLSSLGDLAPLYLGYIDVGAATKLVELKIGDGTPGYLNSNLYHLAVGTNRLLKKIDIQNCAGPKFSQALVLSGCPNIEEVYAKGSSITGVDLPESGYLKILQLPATIANLTLKNQPYLEDLTIEGLTNLKTITIENTPVDTLNILNGAINVERVRLTDVDWHYEDASILYELIERDIGGIDENGTNTDTMWIDGKCHIETLTGNELAEIKRLYPYLDITYDNLTSQLIYMSEDGTTELHRETIYNGGNGNGNINSDILAGNLIYGNIDTNTGEISDTKTSVYTDYININYANELAVSFNLSGVDVFKYIIFNDNYEIIQHVNHGWNGSIAANSWMWCQTDKKISIPELSEAKYIRFLLSTNGNSKVLGEIQGNILINGIAYPLTFSSPFEKQSTAQYHFTFNGWSLTPFGDANSNALLNVESDRYVYVAFSKEIRSYTVRFYNGTTLLQTVTTEYGSNATYTGTTPVHPTLPDDMEFTGWSPKPTNISGDTDCYAQWYDTREITDDWAAIEKACLDGTATNKYAIGAYKNLNIGAVELPYDFHGGAAVVYNGEIHIMGGAQSNAVYKYHYKLNGTEWISVGNLPFNFHGGSAVVYNDEIHLLGGSGASQGHWKYNGTEWINVGTLPYRFHAGSAIVYNNDIHILSTGQADSITKHYKYDGSEWVEVSTLPVTTAAMIYSIVYQEALHIICYNNDNYYFFKYVDSEWVNLGKTPFNYKLGSLIVYNEHLYGMFERDPGRIEVTEYVNSEWVKSDAITLNNGKAVVYNNQLHLLGGTTTSGGSPYDYRDHSYFDGTTWTQFGTTETIPMQVIAHNHDELADGLFKWESANTSNYSLTGCCLYNGKIHGFYSTYHRSYDGTGDWYSEPTEMPIAYSDGSSLAVFNNEIHIMGGVNGKTTHYKYDGSTWAEASTLPYEFNFGSAVTYNNELHIIGGDDAENYHYKWDGSTWTNVGTIPSNHYRGRAIVYNNELHIIGSSTNRYRQDHYKYDGSTWTSVSTLPYDFYNGSVVVQGGKIHIFGGGNSTTSYYTWDGIKWTSMTALPTGHYNSYAFSLNDKIYVYLDGLKYLNAGGWVEQEQLPFDYRTISYSKAWLFDINNKLHIVQYNYHHIWDGYEWISNPLTNYQYNANYYIKHYNDTFYMFPETISTDINIYRLDGTTWVDTGIPFPMYTRSVECVVYDGYLHIYGGYENPGHWIFNGTEFTQLTVGGSKPFAGGSAVVYQGKIHTLYFADHYTFDGVNWVKIGTIPYAKTSYGYSAKYQAVYNDELHVIDDSNAHWKYNGTEWTNLGVLSINHNNLITFRNKLHILPTNTNNKHYVYENPRATLTFLAGNLLKDDRAMNTSKKGPTYNDGGWGLSDLRTWCNGDFITALPTDLQSSITEVIKLYDNGTTDAVIKSVSDKAWIPSLHEVGLVNTKVLAGQGSVYSTFTDNASRIRYKVGASEASIWRLRSTPGANASSHFNTVNSTGNWSSTFAYTETAILIGFCI